MVLVCLPSDGLSRHLPSYLGFSYFGRGVSLHGCSSKAQPLLLTLDKGYLLTAAPPDLERGVAPLGPKFSTQILEVNKKFPHIGKHWPLKKKSRQILASGFALFPISNCLCNAGEISPILQNGCTCWIASCIFSHLLVNLIKYHRHYSPPFPILPSISFILITLCLYFLNQKLAIIFASGFVFLVSRSKLGWI